uniref:inositol-polyphosphate 5-phosphatase n=1 Tax=Eptatretus burgeri TaxID=7764 RepID=A0A8C4QDJ6_EPTBU
MAGVSGPRVLFLTANVSSIFDDPEQLQKNWLQEFFEVVRVQKPLFVAVHCQEVGGKNFCESKPHVEAFVRALVAGEEMRGFTRARIYMDQNSESKENFTALGCLFFLHDSLKNTLQFDFKARRFHKILGQETTVGPLDEISSLEKEKLSHESKLSRKGFIRTRWQLCGSVFDLVNIHLFHDADNITAWQDSPSIYSTTRQSALAHVLDRVTDERYDPAPFFIFGDFNFRLDTGQLIKSLYGEAQMEREQPDISEGNDRLVFTETNNDHKVLLRLEKRKFEFADQDIFRADNGKILLPFDKELMPFKGRLFEIDIEYPPSYPYSEEQGEGCCYNNTRCPAWCDRILMSRSARELLLEVCHLYTT